MRAFLSCLFLSIQLLWIKAHAQNALRAKYREWLEDDDRVEVRSWYAEAEIALEEDWSFEFLGTLDAWSGATPSGLPPEMSDPGNPKEWLNVVSEERRKAGLFAFGKDRPSYSLAFEYGISDEPDYLSRSYALRYAKKMAADTLDLNAGISFQDDSVKKANGIFADKRTPSVSLGLNRILDKFTSLSVTVSYSRPHGYLSDPYKAIPVDRGGFTNLVEENRPDKRDLFVFYSEISKYLEELAMGLHAHYRFFHGDHDMQGHTFEIETSKRAGDSWLWSPRYRFYRQNQSSFYSPKPRAFQSYMISPNSSKGPYYSADHRLSSFDSHSLGLKISHFLYDDLIFEAGYDRYFSKATDGMTDPRVYPEANVFTVGLQWGF